jgi:hypothetical protein
MTQAVEVVQHLHSKEKTLISNPSITPHAKQRSSLLPSLHVTENKNHIHIRPMQNSHNILFHGSTSPFKINNCLSYKVFVALPHEDEFSLTVWAVTMWHPMIHTALSKHQVP